MLLSEWVEWSSTMQKQLLGLSLEMDLSWNFPTHLMWALSMCVFWSTVRQIHNNILCLILGTLLHHLSTFTLSVSGCQFWYCETDNLPLQTFQMSSLWLWQALHFCVLMSSCLMFQVKTRQSISFQLRGWQTTPQWIMTSHPQPQGISCTLWGLCIASLAFAACFPSYEKKYCTFSFFDFDLKIIRFTLIDQSKKKGGSKLKFPLVFTVTFLILCIFRAVFMFLYPTGKSFQFCFDVFLKSDHKVHLSMIHSLHLLFLKFLHFCCSHWWSMPFTFGSLFKSPRDSSLSMAHCSQSLVSVLCGPFGSLSQLYMQKSFWVSWLI